MKKVMVITILFWLVGMGFANAQTTTFTGKLLNSDRTGPFIVTSTDEKVDTYGNRVFKTKNHRVGGPEAHFDLTIDDATGSPTSIDIYGYTTIPPATVPSVERLVSCPAPDFAAISKRPASPTYPLTTGFKAIFLCAFNPNGIGVGTDGVAFLEMGGKQTESAENVPSQFVISGTVTGGFNDIDDNFLFKGTYGTKLKPLIP